MENSPDQKALGATANTESSRKAWLIVKKICEWPPLAEFPTLSGTNMFRTVSDVLSPDLALLVYRCYLYHNQTHLIESLPVIPWDDFLYIFSRRSSPFEGEQMLYSQTRGLTQTKRYIDRVSDEAVTREWVGGAL